MDFGYLCFLLRIKTHGPNAGEFPLVNWWLACHKN